MTREEFDALMAETLAECNRPTNLPVYGAVDHSEELF